MFHLIYSNSYEILRAELIEALTSEQLCGEDCIFHPIQVITPTSAIKENLRRAICEGSETGLCSGIEFCSIQNWMRQYVGKTFVGDVQTELVWCVYRYLQEHSDLQAFKAYASGTDRDRFELASRLASVLVKYVNYRFDWVQLWTESEGRASGYIGSEGEFLQKAQCEWQVELLREVNRYMTQESSERKDESIGSRVRFIEQQFKRLGESVTGADKSTSARSLHIFLNSMLSPLTLPMLALESVRRDIYVYLMTPSCKYWTDTEESAEIDDQRNLWMRNNAASERALIARFWNFVPETGYVDPSAVCLNEAQMKKGEEHHFSDRAVIRFNLNDLTQTELNPRLSERHPPIFLNLLAGDSSRATLLQKIHEAALMDKNPTGLDTFDACADQSLRILKAPGLVRQIEAVTDWIQTLIHTNSDITASDVLVVTPSIDEAAPLIEGVMRSMDTPMAYSIVGRSLLADQTTQQAILQAQKLLLGRMDSEALFAVLETPLFVATNRCTAADISMMKQWLTAAGFRYGLNERHLKSQGYDAESDGTLERTLERLYLGAVMNTGEKSFLNDTLAFDGTEGAFESVADHPESLKVLVRVQRLLDRYLNKALGTDENDWSEWSEHFIEELFPATASRRDFNEEIVSYSRLTQEIKESILAAGCRMGESDGQRVSVGLSVFLDAVESALSVSVSHQSKMGAVTFSDMKEMRYIPFKAIAMIGLDSASAFPGVLHAEEFDLIETLRIRHHTGRSGDRDSRSDNRNIFFDYLMAARRYVLIVYDAGSDPNGKNPKTPSVVVEDFLQWLSDCGLNVSEITATEPISRYSSRSFVQSRQHFFQSSSRTAVDAFNRVTTYLEPEPCFVDEQAQTLNNLCRLTQARTAPLELDKLLDVWNDPDSYVLRELGFDRFWFNKQSQPVGLYGVDNAKFLSGIRMQMFQSRQCDGVWPESHTLEPRLGEQALRADKLEREHKLIDATLATQRHLTEQASCRVLPAEIFSVEDVNIMLTELRVSTLGDGTQCTLDVEWGKYDYKNYIARALGLALKRSPVRVRLITAEKCEKFMTDVAAKGSSKTKPFRDLACLEYEQAYTILKRLKDFYERVRSELLFAPAGREEARWKKDTHWSFNPLWRGQEAYDGLNNAREKLKKEFEGIFTAAKTETVQSRVKLFLEHSKYYLDGEIEKIGKEGGEDE